MKKKDLLRKDVAYFNAKSEVDLIKLEAYPYLKLMGNGKILGDSFNESTNSFFFFIKILQNILKKQKSINFTTPKLELLKWNTELNNCIDFIDENNEKDYYWIMLFRIQEFVSEEYIEEAKEYSFRKKQIKLAENIELEEYSLGDVVQILHKGDFGTEHFSLGKIKKYMEENDLEENGFYQEVNLSYPRKVIPQNMKRIIRIPCKKRLSTI